jgi:chorismate lyase/3-hydroxybenzoate synthase
LNVDVIDAASAGFAVVRTVIRNAAGLGAPMLEELTVRAYNAIFERLSAGAGAPRRFPVRFWNFLPRIHEDMGDGRDRYMVFNAGRYRAFETWYGGRDAFDGSIATASAVGHDQADLTIYALAADAPGRPLDNPRQIKAYRYSSRFGPLPPCFARATILNSAGGARLLVGGTASIRGEDSVHIGDAAKQTKETFENLAALVIAARSEREDADAALGRFRELRVYHPNASDADVLLSMIQAALPNLSRLEVLRADLCRSELLVEIEGVADLE